MSEGVSTCVNVWESECVYVYMYIYIYVSVTSQDQCQSAHLYKISCDYKTSILNN